MEYLDKPKWALDLEKNMEKLRRAMEVCPQLIHEIRWFCRDPFVDQLSEHLKACGPQGFYKLCGGFPRIAELDPYFDPAIEAAKLKEEELIARIQALEAEVKKLSVKKG